MEILGLSGFARSGKDEAAELLVEEFGFKRVAFADKLREVLYALNPIISSKLGYNYIDHWAYSIHLADVIDRVGWNGYKNTEFGAEIRRLLQRLGTEAGRQTLWDTIWIDAALTGHDPDAKIVVSDARFFNEFDAIRERGGEIWRVERDGVGPANEHPSETEAIEYPHFDKTIRNDGTLEEYHETIRSIANASGF